MKEENVAHGVSFFMVILLILAMLVAMKMDFNNKEEIRKIKYCSEMKLSPDDCKKILGE